MVATHDFFARTRGPRRWREVRTAIADATLVLSILSGGCTVQRPEPEDDDDEDCDEACPEEAASTESDAAGEPAPSSSTPPDEIPGSSNASCCTAHWGLGCADHTTESCVCGLDPKCCTEGWDATCAMTAEQLCQSCGGDAEPWG